MDFLDKLKDAATQARHKAVEVADQRGPQIKQGIEKAGAFVNEKTRGKYADKVAIGTEKAGDAVDQLAAQQPHSAQGSQEQPAARRKPAKKAEGTARHDAGPAAHPREPE